MDTLTNGLPAITWKDARVQAADEDAHLVTITSEAEQIWLEAIFGALARI